jgi:HEPN domain-containing protein
MPPTDVPKGSPADWLRHARSDLQLAKSPALDPDVLPETLCFHAQQSVEKAIKAVLVFSGIAFPKTHNIGVLLELLHPQTPRDRVLSETASLTDFAVTSRYPSEVEDVTEEELCVAIAIAERVLAWASKIVSR